MPLRDRFRPALDDLTSWEGFHGQWPAMIVQALARKLPRRYVAAPRVHSGSYLEIDVTRRPVASFASRKFPIDLVKPGTTFLRITG